MASNPNDLLSNPAFATAMAQLFELAGFRDANKPVTPENIQEAVKRVRQRMPAQANVKPMNAEHSAFPAEDAEDILIVGLLGIINYQLKNILKNLNYNVTIVKSADEAIEEFQKKDYKKIIIDLFMPTEYEGFYVLDELKKVAILCSMKFNIVVLSNPVHNQKKLEADCAVRGADLFLVRVEGWQNTLVNHLLNPDGESEKPYEY